MKFLIGLLFPALVFAAPSSQRQLTGSTIKNGAGILTLPTSSDTLVGKATTDVFTNKTFDAAGTGNVLSNVANANIASGAAIDFSKLVSITGDISIATNGVSAYATTVPIAKGGTNNASLAVTAGGALYTDGSKVVQLAPGTSGAVYTSGGTGAPSFTTLTAPTKQIFTTAGTQTGIAVAFTGSPTYALGDTYTDGSAHTYVAIIACAACSTGYFSGTSTVSGSPLSRSIGAGTASLVFSSSSVLSTYTPPAGIKIAELTVVGAGAAGGSCATTGAAQCAAASGGGAGATAIKWITNFTGPIYYTAGVGGAHSAAGANAGGDGTLSAVVSAALGEIIAKPGGGGQGAVAATPIVVLTPAFTAATASGGDINVQGQAGAAGLCASATAVIPGAGGSTLLGIGGYGNNGASAGSGFGAGGAGCGLAASTASTFGANGSNGGVLFREFYQ